MIKGIVKVRFAFYDKYPRNFRSSWLQFFCGFCWEKTNQKTANRTFWGEPQTIINIFSLDCALCQVWSLTSQNSSRHWPWATPYQVEKWWLNTKTIWEIIMTWGIYRAAKMPFVLRLFILKLGFDCVAEKHSNRFWGRSKVFIVVEQSGSTSKPSYSGKLAPKAFLIRIIRKKVIWLAEEFTWNRPSRHIINA